MILNFSGAELALILSCIAGLSSLAGALFIFMFKGFSLKAIVLGLSFSAGIMVYLSFFELLPESIEGTGSKPLAIAYFMIGAMTAYLIDIVTHRFLDRKSKGKDGLDLLSGGYVNNKECREINYDGLSSTGLFVAIALALHNFPEGVVTFTSALLNPVLGFTMVIAVAIHNIPEGFCVALPVYCETKSRAKSLLYAFIAGVAEPIGALFAWIFLASFYTDYLMGILLAGVAGIMFYVAIDELIPAARKLGHSHMGILGVIAGILFMFFVMILVG